MMKSSGRWLACAFLAARLLAAQSALQRPDVTFKIFQFPGDKIPRIGLFAIHTRDASLPNWRCQQQWKSGA
jgi:hypothetical protein